MSSSVRVMSLEELERFREAMVGFVDAASDALLLVDMEVRRFVEWIRHEQPRILHQQHLNSMEEVAQAKNALNRKRLGKVDDREPDVTEERDALRRAQRKQEYIEERIKNVKKWGQIIDQVVDDYNGEARQLSNLVEGNPPASVGFLDRAIEQLHAYLEVEAPRSSSPDATSSMARPADAEPTESTPEQKQEKETPTDGSP